jgi:hypothetical protein
MLAFALRCRPVVSGSMLQRHGRDLTQEAAEGRLDPLVGRQDVLARTLQVGALLTAHAPAGHPSLHMAMLT